MQEFTIKTEKCKGCSLCVRACPKDALSLSGSLNKNGYITVVHDKTKCVWCGLCYQTCPDCVFEIQKEGK